MAKKKKVRVAFKKNRQKRTRTNDLTREFNQGGSNESVTGERIRAKGELSRRRTVIAEDNGEGAPVQLSVDLTHCELGKVVRIHGLISVVEDSEGREVRCGVRRILKTMSIEGRNVVAVGDKVWFRHSTTGSEGMIEKVEARKGSITRGYRLREHVIVTNVDQLLIVSALAEPGLKLPLIDRYLISAEKGGVRPIIVLNKADLVDVSKFQWVIGLYSQLGYETIFASAADKRGIGRLKELLSSGATAFSGQSGVGKSSLLNAIQPGLNLRIGEVSDWTFKGKHTTTTAELIRLKEGGHVIDTPGLRQFELWGVEPAEVEGYFIEFRPYIPKCKFPDCTHTHEGECAVKDAVADGQIHFGRYESYLKLYFGHTIEES